MAASDDSDTPRPSKAKTVRLAVAFPVTTFDSGVAGVELITRHGVDVAADKADAVRAAAHTAAVTLQEA